MKLFRRSREHTDAFELRAYVVPDEEGDYFRLQVDLLINGRGVGVPTDLTELERALAGDGEFFIRTCNCGVPGCAGRFKGIKIEHQDDRITFRDLDVRPQPRFSFDAHYVRLAFQDVLRQGARLAELLKGKRLVSIPDQN